MKVTKEDCETQGLLTQLIANCARWNISTQENIYLTRCIEWLNSIGERFDLDMKEKEEAEAKKRKEKNHTKEKGDDDVGTASKHTQNRNG